MSITIFTLVMISALMHSGWNFVARKVSGNDLVIWLANCVTVIFLSPFLFFLETPLCGQDVSLIGWISLVLTGLLHIAYYRLLGVAYRRGEVSIVYPVSRGMGVAILPIILSCFFGEELSATGISAIVIILCGIITIGLPALIKKEKHNIVIPVIIGVIIIGYSLTDKTGATAMNPVFYLWGMTLFYGPGQAYWMIQKHKGRFRRTVKKNIREIVLIGVADPSAYLIILYCYTLGAASYIIALREFSVVIASFLGMVVLKERFTWNKVVAVVLITFGMIMMKMA